MDFKWQHTEWLYAAPLLFLAIVIFIFSYFMQILGSSLQVPMSVAAWTPAIAISLIGAIILARTDES